MIRITRPAIGDALLRTTRAALTRRQNTADTFFPGDPRIRTAWATFLRSNAKDDVAAALDRCFRFKCAYCENVAAQDIEHFYPKSAYPKRMFRWTNFLRGCKNCNNAKRDHFPRHGRQRLLLDPCEDDPLDYFVWDGATGAIGLLPNPARARRGQATRDLF